MRVLFLAIFLLGTAQTGNPALPSSHTHRMRDIIPKLSPAGQTVFKSLWLPYEMARAAARKDASRAAELNVFATMDAANFDARALRRAYAHQRDVYARGQKERQDHLVDILQRLPASDRHIIVNELRMAGGE
ncbi:MAG: periplasmic heavy metal sensor [Alphaproteobacteria bacterium]|nr:periplasmic heavy metal sensor [Alphaproteobacteria bacterium]MDE2341093.1 periplasmic heavy metal sensor [Alphaproteobacteria bacterium]